MKAVNKMFNFFKRRTKKAEIKKPVIIMIHGFGKRRTDEYNNLKAALSEYDLEIPALFDQRFEDDTVWHNWVSRAEEKIIAAKNQGREIILIGFSMGGVIAGYLASKFAVKKLILLAPAFEYLTITTATNAARSKFNRKNKNSDEYPELPAKFTSTFMDVVDNCRDAIEKVNCPVMFIHCMKDETIPYTVSLKYYRKVNHDDKKCIILADGGHRILDDERLKDTAICLIRDYIEK